jgi:hypothetical protein
MSQNLTQPGHELSGLESNLPAETSTQPSLNVHKECALGF